MGISIPYPFEMGISIPYPFVVDVDLGNGFRYPAATMPESLIGDAEKHTSETKKTSITKFSSPM